MLKSGGFHFEVSGYVVQGSVVQGWSTDGFISVASLLLNFDFLLVRLD